MYKYRYAYTFPHVVPVFASVSVSVTISVCVSGSVAVALSLSLSLALCRCLSVKRHKRFPEHSAMPQESGSRNNTWAGQSASGAWDRVWQQTGVSRPNATQRCHAMVQKQEGGPPQDQPQAPDDQKSFPTSQPYTWFGSPLSI